MTLSAIIEAVASDRKDVVVYAPDDTGVDLATQLLTRNVTVDHRRLPTISADAFVVVRDDGRFRGAVALSDLLAFVEPPVRRPADRDDLDPAVRAIYELLDNTVFVALTRRQLLATSRELEDRAWRTGRGTLHVGFQSAAAFEAQADLYEELAATTDIEIHLYMADAPALDRFDGTEVHVHTGPSPEVGRFWFIVFDDGADGTQNCALIAEQTDTDEYRGLWTYDASLVDRALDALG
ncbi:DICT sensory domain-containing protein [Haloarcula pelagica]|uniref:DICT sensory domain-containing protein n=1 Tax=Haloarcula pelagica TaxID=3033389 RepID=UPI0024C4116F|nr:DICT sensory domain-containing protein [Halomicroarcula sp. YJ-61-S]